MSELRIYKASAGSGKTFRLTGEYIDLLFENPKNYKNILAVTFTNKASAEMKGRIIAELHKLASQVQSGYTEDLKTKYNLSVEEIAQKASLCLSLILHDFTKFSIETIDSFFQKIIISFIREIGLQSGFTLELDTENVLQEVTDKMLYEIEENEQLKKWLIEYAEEKVEQGNSWNFKNDIITLGRELFKESFKVSKNAIIEKVRDKKFLKKFIHDIRAYQKTFEERLKKLGVSALQIISSNGLSTADFVQGQRGIGGFYEKLSSGTIPEKMNSYVLKCLESNEAWSSAKSEKRDSILSAVTIGLESNLQEIFDIYQNDLPSYNTASQILSYLPVVGIITDLSERIREYTEENNSFLISDAAEFLYQITGNNESPFIYEKTGTYYHYFMIDEFQDTSRLQWHNFKPLIINSLSENHSALLVGDVKQSIYRWRNSDWKILAEEAHNEFEPFKVNQINLDANWRSSRKIIAFNNTAFKTMVTCLQDEYNLLINQNNNQETGFSKRILNVYNQLDQKFPNKEDETEGNVELNFFLKENYREESKLRLVQKLDELQDGGFELKDIAILVRNKKDGKEIAEHLIQHKNNNPKSGYNYDFISNDSLFISNNKAVKILIYSIKYIQDEDNLLNLFSLTSEYLEYKGQKELLPPYSFLSDIISKQGLIQLLPKGFEKTLKNVKAMSVYDAIEYLSVFYQFNKDTDLHPYLQAFKDLIHDFTLNKTAHLSSFLEWWASSGKNKTITINEQQDAIKIITIHKSKGLQYKAVLIPFCNWNIDHAPTLTNILWCKPNQPPFDQVAKLPVRYSTKLTNTIFRDEYEEEKLQAYVDNINLLYVAFTRAEEYLYVCGQREEKANRNVANVSDLLIRSFNNVAVQKILTENWDRESYIFKYGKLEKTDVKNIVRNQEISSIYTSVPLFERFEFNKQAHEYFSFEKGIKNKIEYGKLMHRLFQMIYTKKDVEKVIAQFMSEGKLNKDEALYLQQKILNELSKEKPSQWFSDEYRIMNEPEIIQGKDLIYRPDRVIIKNNEIVIIDYKFGEKEESKHIKQIEQYAGMVNQVQPGNILTAYLWYVNKELIKQVV